MYCGYPKSFFAIYLIYFAAPEAVAELAQLNTPVKAITDNVAENNGQDIFKSPRRKGYASYI